MHIRPAKVEDIPAITSLGKMLLDLHGEFDSEYYMLEQNFDELFGNWIKEQLSYSNQFVLVAVNGEAAPDIPNTPMNNQVIGFISGFMKSLFPWLQTKTVGHIAYLSVDPKYQRKGIGRMLEKEALNWFKNKNISYIEVYTDEKNVIGCAVWDSYEFQPFKKFLRKKI